MKATTKCERCGAPAATRERKSTRARLAARVLADTGRRSPVLEQDPRLCRSCDHDLQCEYEHPEGWCSFANLACARTNGEPCLKCSRASRKDAR